MLSKFGVKSIFESKRSCRRSPRRMWIPHTFSKLSPELPGAPWSSPGAPPELLRELPRSSSIFFWKKNGFRHFPSKVAQNEAPLPKQPLSDVLHRNLRKMKVFCHYNRFQTCSPELAPQIQQPRQFTHTSHEKPAASAIQPLQTSLGLISTLRFLGALCLKALL